MYQDIIHTLNPKPKFNTTFYKDADLYSDGDVEDTIIKIIAENEPDQYTDAIQNHMSWPVYYHLTHIRKNILNWYPFQKESSVLEIGCGLGAITNMLCEQCGDVTAVELSKRRATATLLRCREKENLEIIVGNLNDIKFDKKFDYITLIGVLEYQGTFTDTDHPYLDFLMEIKKLLKPNGKLLIGIENKYGLKYWCGAREDHTGIPFDGMNQYTLTDRQVRTFSRRELEDLIKESGFDNTFFYYPMPDYKLPSIVYSQKRLPRNENMLNVQLYYIPDKTTLIANEMAIYKDVIENGVFEFFANSFLVECSDDTDLGNIIFSCHNSSRKEKYRVTTVFTSDGFVEKRPMNEEIGAAHIEQIKKNHNAMERAGKKLVSMELEDGKLISPYMEEELLEDKVLKAFARKNKFEVYRLLDKVYQEIYTSSSHISPEENILFSLSMVEKKDMDKYGPILQVRYLDMILRNGFYIDGEIQWFDQEWVLEAVPVNYILFRALVELYISFPWVDTVIPLGEVVMKFNLYPVWEDYKKLQMVVLDMASDGKVIEQSQVYNGTDRNACVANIQKLIS